MSERAARLASEFETQVAEFERLLQTLTPDQLHLVAVNTPGERFMDADEVRPVNVVAYHVGSFLPRHLASLRARAAGQQPPPNDADAINAEEAEDRRDVSVDEAVDRLRKEAPVALEFIQGLTDEQLDRAWTTPFGEFTVERSIRMVLIGHLEMHRRSIEATLAAAG